MLEQTFLLKQTLSHEPSCWEKAVANGNTPDPLQIAEGDSDLAQQIVNLSEVLRKLDQSGFSDMDYSKLAELVGNDAIANEMAIPDFERLSELGRGGMGVVFEARQLSLNRIVAVKLLPLGTLDPQAARRFEREATTASSLQHPHIVPIYAAGQAAGTHWYAMPRCSGNWTMRLVTLRYERCLGCLSKKACCGETEAR